jgi:hypothetical protein
VTQEIIEAGPISCVMTDCAWCTSVPVLAASSQA